MKRVLLQSILHKHQTYETVGNYETAHGFSLISVSDMGNTQYEQLVAVHELIEMILTQARGISEQHITDFDKAFEMIRQPGNTDEPGDDPRAPYQKEHQFATKIERLLAAELGIDWDTYEQTVMGLHQ